MGHTLGLTIGVRPRVKIDLFLSYVTQVSTHISMTQPKLMVYLRHIGITPDLSHLPDLL